MKKLLVLMFALGIAMTNVFAAEPPKTVDTKPANIQEMRKSS